MCVFTPVGGTIDPLPLPSPFLGRAPAMWLHPRLLLFARVLQTGLSSSCRFCSHADNCWLGNVAPRPGQPCELHGCAFMPQNAPAPVGAQQVHFLFQWHIVNF